MTKQSTKTETPKAAAKKPNRKKAAAKATPEVETVAAADDGDELVVFAIRLKRSERDAIHKAAGPAKASSFVRGLSLAVARLDSEGVAEIIEETRVRLEA